MSVVSERQRQAGSGSAPVTPQENLSPAVPTPSISRNPLRGSKCNCLHDSLASNTKAKPQMLSYYSPLELRFYFFFCLHCSLR
jgi:hypothetical protein